MIHNPQRWPYLMELRNIFPALRLPCWIWHATSILKSISNSSIAGKYPEISCDATHLKAVYPGFQPLALQRKTPVGRCCSRLAGVVAGTVTGNGNSHSFAMSTLGRISMGWINIEQITFIQWMVTKSCTSCEVLYPILGKASTIQGSAGFATIH